MANDVIIRISATNLSAKAFNEARKQLDDLGKKAGLTQGGFSQMGKGFQSAASQLASFNPTAAQATSLLGGFGVAGIAAGVGIGAVATAVGFSVGELVEMGSRLTDLSRTTRITTDALQRMEAFGAPLGMSLEQMASSSNKLDKALGAGGKGVNDALRKLGLNLDSLSAMTADERLRTVQIALSNLKNPLDQASVGAALLGKSWAEMRLSAKDIEEGNKALESTITLSGDAVAAGDRLGDSWDLVWHNIKASAAEMAGPLASALAGVLESTNQLLAAEDKRLDINLAAQRLRRERGEGGDSFAEATAEERITLIQQQKAYDKALAESAKRTAGFVSEIEARDEAATTAREGRVERLRDAFSEQEKEAEKAVDKLAKAQEKAGEAAKKLYREQISAVQDLDKAIQAAAASEESGMNRLDEAALGMAESWETTKDQIQEVIDLIESAEFGQGFVGGMAPDMSNIQRGVASGFDLEVGVPQEELDEFGLSLQAAADISQIFGDNLGLFGDALLQGSAAAAQLEKGFSEEGLAGAVDVAIGALMGIQAIANATSSGSQGSRAARGAIAGAQIGTSIMPGWGTAIGAGVGALVGWLRGKGPADLARDVGRDMGTEISQGLAETISESGESIQTFLTEIFAEGEMSIDRFAEEVGDLFSMLERGELSEETVFAELMEDLPILIEHFDELGEVGQENLARIMAAAEAAGIDLGEMGDQLARLQAGIPEETLEGMAEALGVSVEKARELAELMGVQMQTDLERLADDLNIPVETLQAAFDALSAQGFADDIGDIQTILDSMGITIEELLAQLGIELPEAAETAEGAIPEAGAVFDSEATGAAMANHLAPGQKQITQGLDLVNRNLDRLGDKIVQGIRDAVAQGT